MKKIMFVLLAATWLVISQITFVSAATGGFIATQIDGNTIVVDLNLTLAPGETFYWWKCFLSDPVLGYPTEDGWKSGGTFPATAVYNVSTWGEGLTDGWGYYNVDGNVVAQWLGQVWVDHSAPTITVNSVVPLVGSYISTSAVPELTVIASYSDSISGIRRIIANVTEDGHPADSLYSSGSWFGVGGTLGWTGYPSGNKNVGPVDFIINSSVWQEGHGYNIALYAEDNARNMIAIGVFAADIRIDNTAPIVTITHPHDGQVSPSAVITVSADVAEVNEVVSVKASLNEVELTKDESGKYSGLLLHPIQGFDITVTARDVAGNEGTDKVSIVKVHDKRIEK